MKFLFPPFKEFIKNYTIPRSRKYARDVNIVNFVFEGDKLQAIAKGSSKRPYLIEITLDEDKVKSARCTCPYNLEGYCKHIIKAMHKADELAFESFTDVEKNQQSLFPLEEIKLPKLSYDSETEEFRIANKKVLSLTKNEVESISSQNRNRSFNFEFISGSLEPNKLEAELRWRYIDREDIKIQQTESDIILSCTCCKDDENKLCIHLRESLKSILISQPLSMPFNESIRRAQLSLVAEKIGLKDLSLSELEDLFQIKISYSKAVFEPKLSILPVTDSVISELKDGLLPDFNFPKEEANQEKFILITKTDYGSYEFSLHSAPLKQSGGIKSPINELDVKENLAKANAKEEVLFYTAFLEVNYFESEASEQYSLKNIFKNTLEFPVYFYDASKDYGKPTPRKLNPVELVSKPLGLSLHVEEKEKFYSIICQANIDNQQLNSKSLKRFDSVLKRGSKFYYIDNQQYIEVLTLFENNKHQIYIHKTQFDTFKKDLLDLLEDYLNIQYDFVKKAPKKLIKSEKLDKINQQKIYLSESEDFILITPVMTYGEQEIPVLSKRNLYTKTTEGEMYSAERNSSKETDFIKLIQKLHSNFETIPYTDFFYLHKKEFLEKGWFLEAFEAWKANDIEILGFKNLKDNLWNPNKINVSIQVKSNIDWFDIHTEVQFGEQIVDLKSLQKAVYNKAHFIELGDGTRGLLPEEWLAKFANYFRSSEIDGDKIRTHKSNFSLIDEWFEEHLLSEETKIEIAEVKRKLNDFKSVKEAKIPINLKAELRNYQIEGLNWLNFLDEFGFGGILADDMGLGKTVQVLSYILLQLEKGYTAPNLVIVPTSLLYNWEKEIQKFAPSLNYLIHYGPSRNSEAIDFTSYNVILTTYGTSLSDIELLRKETFNLIVLDESQAIKNPNSKRYKAVRLLSARQRIAMTGTPVENNTFDLYAQLSFVMPGLLGSAKQFKDNYATLIDTHQNEEIALELQRKVYPFILRRTKKQVATELPDKTEMVLYCEMGKEQRKVYEAYKKEFQDFLQNSSDDEFKKSSLHVLQGLTKLRQICNSPALLSDEAYYGAKSSKLDELFTKIDELKDKHKIIVFSQFVGMLELIKEALDKAHIKYAYLTGKTRKREEQVEFFQNDEETRVFLISLKAGGTGLNLTEAEYVFIVDPWWNPAVENQAIDRAYRIGQKNNVTAIRLIVPNTIEEKIVLLQERKRKLAEDLIHVDQSVLKTLNRKDLLEIL